MGEAQSKSVVKCDQCHSDKDVTCEGCNDTLCTANKSNKLSQGNRDIFLNSVDVKEKRTIGDLFCEDHLSERYCLYCKDCQNCVCLRCIVEGHKSHDFVKLSDIVDDKKKELASLVESFQQDPLSELEKVILQIENNKSKYERGIDECVADIAIQEEKLKDIIHEIADKVRTDLYRKANVDRKFMKDLKEEYIQPFSELREIIEVNKQKINSLSGAELIKSIQTMKAVDLQKYKDIKKPLYVTPPTVTANKADHNVLKQQLGSLDFETEQESASDFVS